MLEAHKGGFFFYFFYFFYEYVKQMDLDGKKVLGKDVLFYRHAFQHLELIIILSIVLLVMNGER